MIFRLLSSSILALLPGILAPGILSCEEPARTPFADVDSVLRQEKTSYFRVMRDATGRWSTGHPDSYYAQAISDASPAFTVSNGAVQASVTPAGELSSVLCYGSTYSRPSEWPGGWVSWPRIEAGPVKFEILLAGRLEEPSASWPASTAYLLNALPLTEYQSKRLQVRVVTWAPISADGRQRPRALLWAIALQNRTSEPLSGDLVIPALQKGTVRHADGRPLTNDRITFRLHPGEGAWFPMTVAVENNDAAIEQVARRTAFQWLLDTTSYWRRVTGRLSISDDHFTAELLTRLTVLSLESPAFDEKQEVAGILAGASPVSVADNFRDFYYAILAAPLRDPALARRVIPWFAAHAIRPTDPHFQGGISHSLGNSLNAVMLAGLYYDATGDKEFFRSNPELTRQLTGLLEQVLATRKPGGPWLFPSSYVSDGRALGDYHTGSNVCAWRSFRAWSRILEEATGDKETAGRYREIAAHIKQDLDEHNIIQGPFGPQYIEGTNADGTVPVMIHDGEETDTALMPFYGYLEPGNAAYHNFMRFAASPHNVAFRPETRGIVWEDYGQSASIKPVGGYEAAATFPSYVTALAGSLDNDALHGSDGTLDEIRRLTDVNGAWWWWPYGKAARRGQGLRRLPFESGWAEGTFSVLFPANFLGISYDGPTREFRLAPLKTIGDFSWDDFPIGSDHFSVSFGQGAVTFKNLSTHSVTFRAFSKAPIRVVAGGSVRVE